MVRSQKVDELLRKIADKVGLVCLSDLRFFCSAKSLITTFLSLTGGDYTTDEWVDAMGYICSGGEASKHRMADQDVVFWNIGIYGQSIADAIECCFGAKGMLGAFHYVQGEEEPQLAQGRKYLLFYRADDRETARRARAKAEREKLDVEFAAVCVDYGEGIAAMDQGDSYALKVPLEQEKIIHCYERFSQI